MMEVAEDVRAAALALMAAELDALLIDKEVSMRMRGTLAHLGFTKFVLFANFASTEEGLRKELKGDPGIDSSDPISVRFQLSAVIEAWKSARERLKAKEESSAEARATGRPQQLPQDDAISLRIVHETRYGGHEDSEYPSKDLFRMEVHPVRYWALRGKRTRPGYFSDRGQ